MIIYLPILFAIKMKMSNFARNNVKISIEKKEKLLKLYD